MLPEKIRLLNVSIGDADNADTSAKWICQLC
jgi:hypothetical protein